MGSIRVKFRIKVRLRCRPVLSASIKRVLLVSSGR